MTFAQAATRCWSAAATVLGWRPAEFWQATPAELLASLTVHEAAVDPVAAELLDELRQRFPD
ncbi:MAG: hypothetical protein AVDCRST_MAG31-212 [uncultured Sphingomonas sp.]|uniref:Phage tail assembly chaperone n=1 Tax=uncultured Sphingomonas sp. TaxID=158754 RepID=A0A6J4SH18_9SPHN|nr:phage tail assembly chaperone [uncultured Sphingomonas sp.]CAA9498284.1 MAG: hypothetical protein AVDCRST_MAG31-212 [uncultured Sphingomonas sp.]